MPALRLAFRFESITNTYRARYLKELTALGLGPGQSRILEFVLDNPGVRQSVIANTLQLHKSVVSRSLKSMERYGYVVRRNHRVEMNLLCLRTETDFPGSNPMEIFPPGP